MVLGREWFQFTRNTPLKIGVSGDGAKILQDNGDVDGSMLWEEFGKEIGLLVCFFIKKGEGDIFYEQLQQLNKLIREEWISQGNSTEDFQKLGPKIILILDNASFHKRKDILAKIAQELPNFIL